MNIRHRTISSEKSKARLMNQRKKITFDGVAVIDEAKLVKVIDFLKQRRKFQVLGGIILKRCLLTLTSSNLGKYTYLSFVTIVA